MNCIIVEDQPPAQRILKKFIKDIGTLELKGTFSNAIDAMEFLQQENIDLIFLDIHLPKLSGIDFLKMVKHPPQVILTTAFSDYALESYELDVVDYLLKPFSFARFVKAVSKVTVRTQHTPDPSQKETRREIFIKSGYDHIKISVDDIIYIKSDADYTELFLPGKKHLSSEPLRYWLEYLDPSQFMRIHKSYIINTGKVEKMSGNQLFLIGEVVVPIGRAYKDNFVNRFIK